MIGIESEQKYIIKIMEPPHDIADVVTLTGDRSSRVIQWRKYLSIRVGTTSISECNRIAKALGFLELVDWASYSEH